MMPGSAWGSKQAHVQPVDIKAYKITGMTQTDWDQFLRERSNLVGALADCSSVEESKGLLKEVMEDFLEWKEERDRRHTVRHYIQVKKDKDWLTDDERNELLRLSERDGAVPIFVYSYIEGERLRRYRFCDLKTGVEFGEEGLS